MRFRSIRFLVLLCTVGTAIPLVATTAIERVQPAAAPQAPASAFAAAPDQLFTDGGVTLRFKDVGSGEPVLLIHGYTAALESMAGVAAPLVTSNRVVALDVRGFGKSSKFAEPERFGQLMVDDVVRLMDHLKIQRAHIVGHSMGALIGANVAVRYPARVASATLIAGPFYADKATFTKEMTPWLTDLQTGKGLDNFIQWLFPKMPPKMGVMVSAQAMKTNELSSLIAVLRSLPDLAIPGLGTSGVKSVVAVGTVDPLHPLSAPFVKASSGAQLVEVDGADHVSVATTAQVVTAMRELLKN